MRAKCPCPTVPKKVCDTSSVDPKIVQFLSKTGCNPYKGLQKSSSLLRAPKPWATHRPSAAQWVDPKSYLYSRECEYLFPSRGVRQYFFKVDPKLSNLSITEVGEEADDLFGDFFVKDLGKYMGNFTALEKTQSRQAP